MTTSERGLSTAVSVSSGSRHRYIWTVVSTGLSLAITRKRFSFQSSMTGGLVSGRGYGTTCGTTRVMRPLRRFAKAPAFFSAANVDWTDVKITATLSRDSVSTIAGGLGNPGAGARTLSRASDMSFFLGTTDGVL